jgi:pantothenate kinase
MYEVFCEIVDKEELEDLLDDVEEDLNDDTEDDEKETVSENADLDKVNNIANNLKNMTNTKKEVKLPNVNDLPDNLKQFKTNEENLEELSAEKVGAVNNMRMMKPAKTKAARNTLMKAVKKKWLESQVGKIK